MKVLVLNRGGNGQWSIEKLSALRLDVREVLWTKLCVVYLDWDMLLLLKSFFNSRLVLLELTAGFISTFPVFTAAFPLGKHSSLLKSERENKKFSQTVRLKSELHLPFRRVSSKELLFGWKRRKSGYTPECTPHSHPLPRSSLWQMWRSLGQNVLIMAPLLY